MYFYLVGWRREELSTQHTYFQTSAGWSDAPEPIAGCEPRTGQLVQWWRPPGWPSPRTRIIFTFGNFQLQTSRIILPSGPSAGPPPWCDWAESSCCSWFVGVRWCEVVWGGVTVSRCGTDWSPAPHSALYKGQERQPVWPAWWLTICSPVDQSACRRPSTTMVKWLSVSCEPQPSILHQHPLQEITFSTVKAVILN